MEIDTKELFNEVMNEETLRRTEPEDLTIPKKLDP